jgi:hypothetical protein
VLVDFAARALFALLTGMRLRFAMGA